MIIQSIFFYIFSFIAIESPDKKSSKNMVLKNLDIFIINFLAISQNIIKNWKSKPHKIKKKVEKLSSLVS